MQIGYSDKDTMNLGQYKDTKDMESVMLTRMHLYSSVDCSCLNEEYFIEERIKKIRKLRKKLSNKSVFNTFCKKVKDLF